MTYENSGNEPTAREQDTAHRVRVPGLVTNEEVGLGDVLKRATAAVGIKPCSACQRRAAALNRWVVFTSQIK